MTNNPPLDLLATPENWTQRLQRSVVTALYGTYPAAMHVMEPRTQLNRRGYFRMMAWVKRGSPAWTTGEVEMFSAFVSFLNHCRF